MYAVVVNVTVNDREAAEKRLREAVVPRVSQLPGVIAGYWTRGQAKRFVDGRVRVRGCCAGSRGSGTADG